MSETNREAAELEVRHEERGGRGAFFVEGGAGRVAELVYSAADGRAVIEHTEVSDALQGRGVGRKLVEAAVSWARASGTRLVPLCPYARSVLERDASLRDVLA